MNRLMKAAADQNTAANSATASLARTARDAPERPFVPAQIPADRKITLLVFAFSVAYLWLFRRYTFMEPDEGIILQGAQRILRGQVLYRDFFSFFTPGSYYFLALLFRIFGNSFLVARTALVFFG